MGGVLGLVTELTSSLRYQLLGVARKVEYKLFLFLSLKNYRTKWVVVYGEFALLLVYCIKSSVRWSDTVCSVRR